MTPAIQLQGISKRYRLAGKGASYRTLREAIAETIRSPWRRRRSVSDGSDSFWALKDVSLEIEPGEVVGLIGRNGAGKSTLLKILSQITEPTIGQVRLRGRVGSLLEIGTGFHPELTGRENIYLNGVILGLSRREIDQRFDEIVAFSEVEKFLDMPVKYYSSGMYVRLGFSVAAILTPEIMLVDEVLAVGDLPFQKKCLGKMKDVGQSGRTVLLVSHNLPTIENLCPRTIWLGAGEVIQVGPSRDVIQGYLDSFGAGRPHSLDLATTTERSGIGGVRFERLELMNLEGQPLRVYRSGEGLRVRLHYACQRDLANLHFGVRIYTHNGVLLSDVHTWTTGQPIPLAPEGTGCIEVTIDSLNFMPGTYLLGIWAGGFECYYDVLESAAKLEVEASDYYGTGRGIENRFGTVFLPFRWSTPTDGASGSHAQGQKAAS